MLQCLDNDQTRQNDWPNRSGGRQPLANPDCAVRARLAKVAKKPAKPANMTAAPYLAPARHPDQETHA